MRIRRFMKTLLALTGAIHARCVRGASAQSESVVIRSPRSHAADARDGKPLWNVPMNVLWKASPMTSMFDNTRIVAVAAGSAIVAFALPNN